MRKMFILLLLLPCWVWATVQINGVHAGATTICLGNGITLTATGATTYSWNTGSASASFIVMPAIATTYKVTGYVGGIAVDSATLVVNVSSVTPNAGADVTICSGNSTLLTASGGGTYSWSPATALSTTNQTSSTCTATTTTLYTVTVTNAFGCTAQDNVLVTVNATPSGTVAYTGQVCTSKGIPFSISNPLNFGLAPTYQWFVNGVAQGGETNPTFTYSSLIPINVDITVNVTNTNTGCAKNIQ